MVLDTQSATRARIGDREVIVFCSNDYLGLRTDARFGARVVGRARMSPIGSGASRLVSGTSPVHETAERAIAGLVDQPAALLVSSGYAANVGAIPALAGDGDVIFSDADNHASIVDGCRLARARTVIVPHCDADAVRAAIGRARPFRRGWILTETVFSMSGDVAPLRALAALRADATLHLYVDEAHAIGVFGAGGRGVAVESGVRPDVTIGTLGKALGSGGAFIAGSDLLRVYLWNRCRSFVYSTAVAPPIAHAASVALDVLRDEPDRLERLRANAGRLRASLRRTGIEAGGGDGTAIVPVIVGDDARAVAVAEALLARGFFVQPIRPPTVPAGTARLRITASSEHSFDDVDALAAALAELHG